ncbi:MAG: hypothetical protein IPM74_09935 [Crocinitomicaceae bacterium]|nr:hypothetical protein [Crocinitomicaceae bacterium]
MQKSGFILFTLIILNQSVISQQELITIETLFRSESITYNGSDNPNECMEAVDTGIRIPAKKGTLFLLIPAREFEILKNKYEGKTVTITYGLFSESIGQSGAAGWVESITFEGEIIFQA